MEKPTIGFIGLGSQGAPMAQRILEAGIPLFVWARRPEALEPFVASGARAANSPADMAASCDIVCLCVVNDADVKALADQIIPAMKAGGLLIVHSTVLPQTCEALEARCADAGLQFLDAPVSGGGPAAAAGKLTVMCGGKADAFERAAPLLSSFAGVTVLLGEAGAAQRAKIVNNALMAANMGLAHAAMDSGEALGIDRAALLDLIKVSSGRSFGFEIYARLSKPADFSHGAPLLVKDINLLASITPDNTGTHILRTAANPFLTAATGQELEGIIS